MSDTAKSAKSVSGQLDDMMLAMDVVDTLRHRQHIVARELDAEGRVAALIARLRDIYAAQGIDVSDHILREGVKALDEKRFLYESPKPSLSVGLAKIYVARDQWLKPIGVALAIFVAGIASFQFGVAGPRRAHEAAIAVELSDSIPEELVLVRDRIFGMAIEENANKLASALYRDGIAAAKAGDISAARAARDALVVLDQDISAQYSVTVVSRPGEMSGVFRIPDDLPDARNYYLIVEAIDARGRALTIPRVSEENQKNARVNKWGQRVPKEVFDSVSADKGDDQIIQNAVIGTKSVGRLTPEYDIPVEGGVILEW